MKRMKGKKLLELLQGLSEQELNLYVEINDEGGGEVRDLQALTVYRPNTDLYPDDKPSIVLHVNGS
jgi:hypothetical protein